MNNFLTKLNPNNDIRPLAILISICLSLLWFSYNQPINIDGISYLLIAKTFLQHGLKAAYHYYYWPTYPILIGLTHQLTGFSLFNSAYLLNIIFFALITFAFITLTKQFTNNKTILIISAFVILCYPSIAHERSMFYRDYGYYAFMLFSLNALLSFEKNNCFRLALTWALCTFIAALFRIEGMIFLMLAPFICLFWQNHNIKSKLISFVKLNIFSLAILAISLIMFSYHSGLKELLDLKSIFYQHIFDELSSIPTTFSYDSNLLKEYVLNSFADKNSVFILLGGIVAILLINLIVALNLLYVFLSAYGFKQRLLQLNRNKALILSGYILINCVILLGFLSQNLFITIRYVIFLALILLIPVAFSIYHIFKNSKKVVCALLIFCLLIVAVSSTFRIGITKTYIIEAGTWLQNNTPENARIYMNDPRIVYYSDRPGTKFPEDFKHGVVKPVTEVFKTQAWRHYNYLAIILQHKDIKKVKKAIKQSHLKIIKAFTNNNGDKIFIIPTKTK